MLLHDKQRRIRVISKTSLAVHFIYFHFLFFLWCWGKSHCLIFNMQHMDQPKSDFFFFVKELGIYFYNILFFYIVVNRFLTPKFLMFNKKKKFILTFLE